MNANIKKLIKDTLYLLLSQGSVLMLPLLIFPLVNEYYTQSELSFYIYSLAMCQLMFLVLDFGMSVFGVKKADELEYEPRKLSELLASINALKVLSIVLVTGIAGILYFIERSTLVLVFLFSIPAMLFQSLIPYWLYQSLGIIKHSTFVNLYTRIALIALSLFCIWVEADIYIVILINGLCWFFGFLASIFILNKKQVSHFLIFSLRKNKELMKELSGFYVSRLAIAGYSQTNIAILGALASFASVSFYGIASYLYKIVQAFTSSINQAIYPILTRTKDLKLYLLSSIVVLVLIASGLLVVNIFIEDLITIFYGVDFLAMVDYVQKFMVLSLLSAASMLLGFPLASIYNTHKLVNSSSLFACSVYFVSFSYLVAIDDISGINLLNCLILAEIASLVVRLYAALAVKHTVTMR